jgi:hypothetical protein
MTELTDRTVAEPTRTSDLAGPASDPNSATAGFIVHRVGQLEVGFAQEGREFATELVDYLNRAQAGVIWTGLYGEVGGIGERLHWLVHLRSPHEYQRLLSMVDLDRDYQDISSRDRMPARGGGNWERMFVPGSFSERVLCPQHGFGHPPEGEVDPAVYFTAPARYQTRQPFERQLTTGTAEAVVMRTIRAQYAHRDLARVFAVEWADAVTEVSDGRATAYLYEEVFGHQDTLHWLLHLRSAQDLSLLHGLSGGRLDEVLGRAWAPGEGRWNELFVPGSLVDVPMLPLAPGNRSR